LIRGAIVPLVTPFREDFSVDEEGLSRLVEHVIAGGVAAIFVLGSCGEFPVLDDEEKVRLVKLTARYIRGRVPLLAGVGEPSTRRSLSLAQRLLDAGAEVIVALAPFYYLYTQEELYRHFITIARALKAPVMVYNIPQTTKHSVSPQLLKRLLEESNIVGLKDSAGNMTTFQEYLSVAQSRPDFSVYQGAEPLAALSLVRGATGVVLGLANLAPRLCTDLYEAAQKGEFEKLWRLHESLMELFSIQQHKSWLAGLKMGAGLLGLCCPYVSEPFEPLSEEQVKAVRATLAGLRLLSGR